MAQAPDNKVSLGCGTLILIALIVMIFSRGNDSRDLSREVRGMRKEVRQLAARPDTAQEIPALRRSVEALQRSMDQQGKEIAALKEEVKKLTAASQPIPPLER
jgi:peptidoglycan hydrolase CwlO-like protein